MPAKPQQMSDTQDKSDDLIAELAKLMASNAQGSESEPKPTVIKLAPLSEATVPRTSPIRIPGMDAPAAPATVAPAVRIPGMEKPASVDTPPVVARTAPEPLSNRQGREMPEPASAEPTPAAPKLAAQTPSTPSPSAAEPVQPEANPAPDAKLHATDRIEAPVAAAPASAAVPPPVQAEAKPAPAGSFNFDFEFNSGAASTEDKEQTSAKSGNAPKPAGAPEHDPIADLIAAELDAAQAEPVKPETPKAETMPAAAVFPASVEAVPARNFGNNTAGQAPGLIARTSGATAPRPMPAAPVSFRPPPQAPKPAESDKFAVAPAFGLGAKPAPTPSPESATASPPQPGPSAPVTSNAPRVDSDPMDEIENLIGEAVRMELSGADTAAAATQAPTPAAPVVPPLTTGFAPRRAGLKDNEPQIKSAEAAILAAAAATGAEVGRIDAEAGEDRPYKRVKMKPQRANMFGGVRQYVGMAVAGTLLLAAGFGLYWVLGMGRGDGTAPVLTADATPSKQVPAVTATETAQPARSVVFDEIDGIAAADSAETLVSRDETAGASVADVASVVTPDSTENTESGLANRKVRTVTVRPDGTIVNGDEAVAGTAALPVERPNVPVVPGAATAPSDLLTAAVAADTGATTSDTGAGRVAELDPIAAAIVGNDAEQPAPLDLAALAPSATPAVFDASIVAPTPMPRPTDRGRLNGAGGAVAAAPTATIRVNAPASTPLVAVTQQATSAGAAAYVQLYSQRSEGDAQASLRNAQSRWGSLFGGNTLEIQRADLGQKGVYYRVRLPAASLQDATQICASIKANGGDCFATNG